MENEKKGFGIIKSRGADTPAFEAWGGSATRPEADLSFLDMLK